MISFLLGIVLLIVGYITYGKIVERVINPDDRSTPAYELQDGVDYIPMSSPRAFLIQLLQDSVPYSVLFPVQFGDRWFTCGSSSEQYLQVVFMTICQV